MTSSVIRLIYASTATFEPNESGGIEVEVARILSKSRRNNKARQIGGVLHYGEGYFFQALEGERELVDEIYKRILQDPRHRDVRILSFNVVKERLFPDWSMKYVPLEDEITRFLARHGMRFHPHEFDDTVIDGFLKLCVHGEDPTERMEEQTQAHAPAGEKKRPWWKRLLGLS